MRVYLANARGEMVREACFARAKGEPPGLYDAGTGERIGPEAAGIVQLEPRDLAAVAMVDAARKLGYRFEGLESPRQMLGGMLGQARSPRKAAAARANARHSAGVPRPNRKPKARPPLEPPMPMAERDAAIRRRRDAGESLRDLAHAYQLSPEAVRQICLGRQAARRLFATR